MSPPTLVILAAGMGSRYGGLKQIDHFGPNGETIMDYALHDALAAGFAKVVFIIRHYFESEFREVVGSRYEPRVAVDYVFQEIEELPPGFAVPSQRTKPWGTAHAIWCTRGRVKDPFVCINADDYYGKNAFRIAAQHLGERPVAKPAPGELPEYCIVGYPVLPTLSEHGGVARAICALDEQGCLTALTELKSIEKAGNTGKYVDETGTMRFLRGDELVSMNMMGFLPSVFESLERHLTAFLAIAGRAPGDSECVLPEVVDKIVREKSARVRVLPNSDAWFGVTHAKDKPGAVAMIGRMVERGEYRSPIWDEG